MTEVREATKEIIVFVNDKPVSFEARDVTGSQIKAKAGAQPNSILYELHDHERIPIGDTQTIRIHEKERFLAVPGGTVS